MTHDAHGVGLIGGIEKGDVKIFKYDPRWIEKFETHKKIIAKAVGENALRIEHIGSTSVPGLAAKPIVDILLVVLDSSYESLYFPHLKKAGYELRVREPYFHEHRMFRTPDKDVHIHVFSSGSIEIERYLTFRDRLRRNPADRKRYEKTKRLLGARSWPHMDAYAEAKSNIIEEITREARKAGEVSK